MFRSIALLSALGATLAAAQSYSSSPANATAVELIKAQFANAGLGGQLAGGQFLGELNAQGLLQVIYGSDETINTGEAYPAGDVANQPSRKATRQKSYGSKC